MNWLTITIDDLKAVALSEIIDTAQTLVTPWQTSPVTVAIADAVSAVRAAVATGNRLDVNAAAVPGSLRALTARLAVCALLERAEVALNDDQRAAHLADAAWLASIRDERQRVEPADQPDPTGATPTSTSSTETITPGHRGNGRGELRGL